MRSIFAILFGLLALALLSKPAKACDYGAPQQIVLGYNAPAITFGYAAPVQQFVLPTFAPVMSYAVPDSYVSAASISSYSYGGSELVLGARQRAAVRVNVRGGNRAAVRLNVGGRQRNAVRNRAAIVVGGRRNAAIVIGGRDRAAVNVRAPRQRGALQINVR